MPDPFDLIATAENLHAVNPSALRSFEHQLIAALKGALHERDMCRTEVLARRSSIPAVLTMKRDLARLERDLVQVTQERDEAIALLEALPGDDDSVLAEEQWTERLHCFLAHLADPPCSSRAETDSLQVVSS